MSFFYNSRAVFPSPLGPTLLYSMPFASDPFRLNSVGCGSSCGASSRAAWGRPRVLLSHKRPFDDFLEEQYFDNIFDAFEVFPPSKHSRSEESSDDEDDMDIDDDCECGDEHCDCDYDEEYAPNDSNLPEKSDENNDAPAETAPSNKEETAIAKPSEFSGSLINSFFANDQNFKVDHSDDQVTITSTWNGFNKTDLNVDFKDGAVIVSGKSEVETKDEKSGTVSKSFKSISKTIRLPQNIDTEGINAKFNDDASLLTITVPKIKKPEKEIETIVIN
jgi:HSP20 family protein